MKADYIDKKLYLVAENDLERSKMLDFLRLLQTERPISVGLLNVGREEDQSIGLFLKVLIDEFDGYLAKIHAYNEARDNDA